MENLSYDRRTTNRQKAKGIMKDTLKVGLPYAGLVSLLSWVLSKLFQG